MKFRCVLCGFEYEGDSLPEDYVCPVCGWHAAILSPAQIFRCHEALKPQKHEMLEPGKRYGCTLPLSDIMSWPSGQIFIDFYLTCNKFSIRRP